MNISIIFSIMKKIIFPLLFLLLIIHSHIAFARGQEDEKVYNDFCSLVSEAMALKEDVQHRHEYIIRNFDERVGNKNLKEAYNVVFQIAPEKRYEALKKSIEKNIKGGWNCDGLKKYFEQYVDK